MERGERRAEAAALSSAAISSAISVLTLRRSRHPHASFLHGGTHHIHPLQILLEWSANGPAVVSAQRANLSPRNSSFGLVGMYSDVLLCVRRAGDIRVRFIPSLFGHADSGKRIPKLVAFFHYRVDVVACPMPKNVVSACHRTVVGNGVGRQTALQDDSTCHTKPTSYSSCI